MNVMKQDAMDDKRKERCKTCEKQCMQKKISMDREVSRYYRAKANLDRLTSYRASIEGTKSCSIDRPSYQEVSRLR